MTHHDACPYRWIARYIFGIYDFDESGVLSIDETILALRSTISGLCKLCGLDPPLESELEAIALMVSHRLLDCSRVPRCALQSGRSVLR